VILIVDDSELFRLNVRSAIEEKFDIDVVEVDTIRRMKLFFSQNPVKEVLLTIIDLNLPDGNGLSAIGEIIEINGGFKLPFIIVSKGVNRAILPIALKYGVGDILAKPINPDELIETIKTLYPDTFIPREKGNKSLECYKGVISHEIRKAQEEKYPLALFIVEVKIEIAQRKNAARGQQSMKAKRRPNSLKMLLPRNKLENVFSITDKKCLVIMPSVDNNSIKAMKGFLCRLLNKAGLIINDEDLIVASAVYPDQGSSTDELINILQKDYEDQQKNL
jgi:DNA-binding NarL/FixJ family response regulator